MLLDTLEGVHLSIELASHGVHLKSANNGTSLAHHSELPFPDTTQDLKVVLLQSQAVDIVED